MARVRSALPPSGARILAFAAILAGGACGGIIGFAVTDLQCTGSCDVQSGIGLLVGALAGAIGVAVVSVLTLRAMGEWRTIEHRGAGDQSSDSRRNPSA